MKSCHLLRSACRNQLGDAAQIGRWKQVIGDTLRSRIIDTQIAEVRTATKVLNRMTGLGRAAIERV